MSESRTKTADKRYYGVWPATVTENVDPDKQGRIKVTYPTFDGDMISEWARLVQPYAGNGFGALFVPERESEVLVAFHHGDMRFPFVIGGLYNGQDHPHDHPDGSAKDPKLIRTRKGHMLIFEDGNEPRVEIVDSTGGNKIVIDAKQNTVTVTAAKDVTIESREGKVIITGQAGVEVTSPQAVKVQSESTLDLGGTSAVNVNGGTINLN